MIDPKTITGTLQEVVQTLANLTADDFPDTEGFLKFARELRVAADQSEMIFTAYLMAYERSDLWRGAVNAGNFDSWLQNFGFDVGRYRSGVEALTKIGIANCVAYGFDAMKAVTKLPPEHRTAFIEEVSKPSLEKRGFPISSRHTVDCIKRYAAEHHIELPTSRTPKSNRLLELEAENENLKQRVSDLVAENKKLKKDLFSRLKKELSASASS